MTSASSVPRVPDNTASKNVFRITPQVCDSSKKAMCTLCSDRFDHVSSLVGIFENAAFNSAP